MPHFYFLSEKFDATQHATFATAIAMMIDGSDSRFRAGDVQKTTTELIAEGKTQDGAEPAPYEVGRWGARFMCEEEPLHPVDGDMYYAWVSNDFWDYEPNLVFYTKEEFMVLFADCCRNYVTAYPDRREEFAEALLKNGMSL